MKDQSTEDQMNQVHQTDQTPRIHPTLREAMVEAATEAVALLQTRLILQNLQATEVIPTRDTVTTTDTTIPTTQERAVGTTELETTEGITDDARS